MNAPRLKMRFVTIVAVAGLLLDSSSYARDSLNQDAAKSLDIERYPNEPLELVDLKIGDQSVKNRIVVKRRKDGEAWTT